MMIGDDDRGAGVGDLVRKLLATDDGFSLITCNGTALAICVGVEDGGFVGFEDGLFDLTCEGSMLSIYNGARVGDDDRPMEGISDGG